VNECTGDIHRDLDSSLKKTPIVCSSTMTKIKPKQRTFKSSHYYSLVIFCCFITGVNDDKNFVHKLHYARVNILCILVGYVENVMRKEFFVWLVNCANICWPLLMSCQLRKFPAAHKLTPNVKILECFNEFVG